MTLSFRRLSVAVAALALVAGCSKDEKSDPPKPPQIKLSATSLTFDATMAGDPAPAAKTVTITNGGGGTLEAPTVSVDFGGGATGWLAVAISGSAAPFTLTATPSTAVAAGPHTATLTVTSPGASNTPATVTVAFTVSANPAPVLALTSPALRFTAEVGEADPAAQTLTVTNGGGDALTDLTADPVTYDVGTDWLTVEVGTFDVSGTTVTVTAATGALARGRYTATLTLRSTGAWNTPVTVPVTFDVTDPQLAVSPAALAFTTPVGTSPVAQKLTVRNATDGTLDVPTATTSAGWLTASVTGTSAPFTVTVSVDGATLTAGTLTADVTIDSANASNGPIVVPVTVTATPATVRCYDPVDLVCQEITTSSGSSAAVMTEQCTSGGGSLYCPGGGFGPCTGAMDVETLWFYGPEYTAATAQLFCSILGGTWEGPVDPGSTHAVSFGCDVAAQYVCTDINGDMTQATEDQWTGLCTGFSGTIVGTCPTGGRIGTCTYTESGITFEERYYTGADVNPGVDCASPGDVWTPG